MSRANTSGVTDVPGHGHEGTALEPELTGFDRRVLKALDQWTSDRRVFGPDAEPLEYRTAWQIAERLREFDVATVVRVLNGLERFQYVTTNGRWDHRKAWVAIPWARERDTDA
jgi:hypothetical protein